MQSPFLKIFPASKLKPDTSLFSEPCMHFSIIQHKEQFSIAPKKPRWD